MTDALHLTIVLRNVESDSDQIGYDLIYLCPTFHFS